MVFDPNNHLIQLKSKEGNKDYLPVQYRLVWVNDDYATKHFQKLEITIKDKVIDLDREISKEIYAWNNETRRSEKVQKTDKGYAYYEMHVEIVDKDGNIKIGEGSKSECAVDFPDYAEKAQCVPLDSEILTRRGFKRHDEITVGEEVLAYDHAHDQCIWTPLRKVTCYGSGTIARLHGKRFDVLCTPDHSWAIKHRNGKRELVKAHDLKPDESILLSAPGPEGIHPLTPKDAAILGWIVTDGNIRYQGNSTRSYICQSKQENVSIIRDLVGSLASETIYQVPTRTFPSGKTYECLPQHRFTFSAQETRRIFNAAGIYSTEDLPEMVTQYSHEARQAMLIAMMMADGDKRGNFGKKRKPGVMEAWQILATLEGFSLGQFTENGGFPRQRMKKRRTLCVSELSLEVIGSAPVWCPTTDYGTWVMRQNGRVMITGNTGAIGRALASIGYGTQFAPELNEEHRIVDAPVERTASNGNEHSPLASVRPSTTHQDGQGTDETVKPSKHTQNTQTSQETHPDAAKPAPITEQQSASIKKLAQHLGKPEPDLEDVTYLAAKELISQLSLEYRQSRKAS